MNNTLKYCGGCLNTYLRNNLIASFLVNHRVLKRHITLKITKPNKADVKKSINKSSRTLFGPVINLENKDNDEQGDGIQTIHTTKTVEGVDNEFDLLSLKDSRFRLPTPSNTVRLSDLFSSKLCLNADAKDEVVRKGSGEIKKIGIFDGGYQKLPSVRRVISETMTPLQKDVLEQWEKRKIEELGEEQFKRFRQGLIDRGVLLHQCIEMKLAGEEEPNEDHLVGIEPFWESIQHVFPKISDVRVLESRVIHPTLHYQGAIDCVAMFRDQLLVIDFKTSSRPKMTLKSTYDDPLQMVAYIGALNADKSYDLPQINSAVLVIAYPTGLPAHIHHMTSRQCTNHWKKWVQKLGQFWNIHGKPAEPEQ